MKIHLDFILSLLSLIGLFYLGYVKSVDISIPVVTILGLFISGRSITNVGNAFAASKDPSADTESVISNQKH